MVSKGWPVDVPFNDALFDAQNIITKPPGKAQAGARGICFIHETSENLLKSMYQGVSIII